MTIRREQLAGRDPLAPWRDAVARQLAVQYAIEPPRQVAAVFVLQWYLSVVAQPLAHLAAAVGVLSPDGLSFALSGRGGYPVQVAVSPNGVVSQADSQDEAERAYRAHADEVARTYQPGVRLSSATRAGSVSDAWDAARATASPGWEPPRCRASCCFIYALPGAHECARCPRIAAE